MTTDPNFIPSPCVSQCCLDEEDICVGCFRHIDEITGWHGADKSRRLEILANCNSRKRARQERLNNLLKDKR